MHPLLHLMLTGACFFLIRLCVPLDLATLAIALVLTILIDILEHSGVLWMNPANPLVKEVRKRLTEKGVYDAYRHYYDHRIGSFEFANFHNLLFLTLTVILAVMIRSYAVCIGLSFHLMCDMLNEYRITRSFRFWTGGSVKMVRFYVSKLLK